MVMLLLSIHIESNCKLDLTSQISREWCWILIYRCLDFPWRQHRLLHACSSHPIRSLSQWHPPALHASTESWIVSFQLARQSAARGRPKQRGVHYNQQIGSCPCRGCYIRSPFLGQPSICTKHWMDIYGRTWVMEARIGRTRWGLSREDVDLFGQYLVIVAYVIEIDTDVALIVQLRSSTVMTVQKKSDD